PTKGPVAPVAAPLSWTGWYAGFNFGVIDPLDSIGTTNAAVLSTSSFPPNATVLAGALTSDAGRGNTDGLGAIGGFQIGYNFQWTPAILIGFETDIQATSLRQSNTLGIFGPVTATGNWVGAINGTRDVDWLGTVRGRIGLTSIIPNWLFYATGGFAYGGVKS